MIQYAFENELIEYSHCGNPQEREIFQIAHPDNFEIRTEGVSFLKPGVYQIGLDSPIIFVRPAFLKNADGSIRDRLGARLDGWFDSVLEFGNLLEETVKYADVTESESSWEPIVFSLLALTEKLILEASEREYFQQVTVNSKSISGKWNIARDLRTTKRPMAFTCTINLASTNILLFGLLRSICNEVSSFVSSSSNMLMLESINGYLVNVEPQLVTEENFHKVKIFIEEQDLPSDWNLLFEFFFNLIVERKRSFSGIGLSIEYPMDTFYEDLVSKVLTKLNVHHVKQYSMDVLGGAKWVEENGSSEEFNALITSRPDIVAIKNGFKKIIEVKYKMFSLPPNRNRKGALNCKPFGRDDRNQILSFVLSHLSESNSQPAEFFVLYPFRGIECVNIVNLIFPRASLEFNSKVSSISVGEIADRSGVLEVKFVGLNTPICIDWLNGNENNIFVELLSSGLGLSDNQVA